MAVKKPDEGTEQVSETALPSVEDSAVSVTTNAEVYATSDAGDPGKGWTAQSEEHYAEADVKSEGVVSKGALPTKEGLKEAGVRDPDTYLSGVVVA